MSSEAATRFDGTDERLPTGTLFLSLIRVFLIVLAVQAIHLARAQESCSLEKSSLFSFLAMCPEFCIRCHCFIQVLPAAALVAGYSLPATEKAVACVAARAEWGKIILDSHEERPQLWLQSLLKQSCIL